MKKQVDEKKIKNEVRRKEAAYPAAAIICRVRSGDRIRTEEKICEEPWVHIRVIRLYEVKAVYRHHVLMEDITTGQRRCFCYGDLIMTHWGWSGRSLW